MDSSCGLDEGERRRTPGGGTSLAVASSASDEWRALARLLFAIRCDCQPGDSDDVVRRFGGREGERTRHGGGLGRTSGGRATARGARARAGADGKGGRGRGQKRSAGAESGWMERAWVPGENHRATLHLTRPTHARTRTYERHVHTHARAPARAFPILDPCCRQVAGYASCESALPSPPSPLPSLPSPSHLFAASRDAMSFEAASTRSLRIRKRNRVYEDVTGGSVFPSGYALSRSLRTSNRYINRPSK